MCIRDSSMITRLGMSDRFGMIALETEGNKYLGGESALACSEGTAREVDEEAISLINNCLLYTSMLLLAFYYGGALLPDAAARCGRRRPFPAADRSAAAVARSSDSLECAGNQLSEILPVPGCLKEVSGMEITVTRGLPAGGRQIRLEVFVREQGFTEASEFDDVDPGDVYKRQVPPLSRWDPNTGRNR